MDIKEVKRLAYEAVSAWNKAEAERYTRQLSGLQIGANLNLNASRAFSRLLCSVRAASGQVREKERKISFMEQDLFKLEVALDWKGGPNDVPMD